MLGALGRITYRWRWPLLGAWLVITIGGALLGGRVFDRLATVETLRPDAESRMAAYRVDRLLPEGPIVVAVVRGRDPYDRPLVDSVTSVAARLRSLPGVYEVEDLYESPGGRIGADNRSSLVRVELTRGLPVRERERVEDRVTALLKRIDAPQVLVGGVTLAERAFGEQATRDAAIGESVALGVLLVLLVVILAGPVAGAIPLVAAAGTVAATLLGLLGLAAVTRINEFTVNVVTLLGIGLTVDYALLMLVRYRRERGVDPEAPPAELLARTVSTAGRAVLLSGLAVAATMAALYAVSSPLLAAMALGGGLVALVATAAGLTAVPALVAVARRRIREPHRTSPSGAERGLLARLAGFAQRRPRAVTAVVGGGLLLLAAPFLFGANLADSDARALPRSMETRQVHDVLLRDFNAGAAEPVVVVVEGDPAAPAVRDLMNRLIALPQVVRLEPRPDVPTGAAVIDLVPRGRTGGPASRDLVREVRAMSGPVRLLVGGPAAELVDYQSALLRRLPLAVLAVVLAGGVLLFALTGSVVIPVKAVLLNAVSLLGTLGALVVVFQWGIGAALIGVEPWGAIDATTPVLLAVFAFGLSMDYEVFLLAAIREEWQRWSGLRTAAARTAGNDRAVLAGITRTGPVVTLAATCMIVVFVGFLAGELTAVQEVGFGMALAVLLDVTLVRGLLLPAVMTLLGEWNWWAPAPLRRLHDRWWAGGYDDGPPADTAPAPPATLGRVS